MHTYAREAHCSLNIFNSGAFAPTGCQSQPGDAYTVSITASSSGDGIASAAYVFPNYAPTGS